PPKPSSLHLTNPRSRDTRQAYPPHHKSRLNQRVLKTLRTFDGEGGVHVYAARHRRAGRVVLSVSGTASYLSVECGAFLPGYFSQLLISLKGCRLLLGRQARIESQLECVPASGSWHTPGHCGRALRRTLAPCPRDECNSRHNRHRFAD